MMVTMRGTDYDTARVASAMKGHLAQQKAVIVFQPSEPGGPEGEHFMASWDVDDDAATTHGKLESLGVTFHTLQPLDGGGTRVFVYGMDQEAFATVEKAGAAYDTEIEFTHGTGEFLGTTKEDGSDAEQRADAQRVYEETLAQAAPHEGRDVGAIWQDVRDHWGAAFGAAKGGEPSKEPGAAEPGKAEPGKAGAAEAVAPREASLEGYSKEATLKNGVIHTADVNDAARALHEGRRVELDQVRSISVLLDRLAAISERMIQRGEKAPTVDLCKVSVAGTNLFCSESKGIPRIEMPQMDEPTTKKFVEHLASKGYKVTSEDQYASYLRATQNELNGSKVAGIAKSMRSGEHEKGPQHAQVYKPPRMVVSNDDYILDGHHRWAAKVGNDSMDGILTNDTKIEISRVDIDIVQLLDEAHKFTEGKGRKGVGDRRTKDFNPYHEPGGSPEGGRFAAGGGSGGGAETRERGGGPAEVKAHPAHDLTRKELLKEAPKDVRKDSVRIQEVAKKLNERAASILKRDLGVSELTHENTTDDRNEYIAEAVAKELEDLVRGGMNEDDIHWYSKRLKEGMRVVTIMHPEVAQDKNAHFAYTLSLAITSQNETVDSNIRLADGVYEAFHRDGVFPTDIKASKQVAMNGNFAKLNHLIEKHGIDNVRKAFSTEVTARELRDDWGYEVSRTNLDDKVYVSAILGPKIGQGFFQNLTGNFKPFTMDMWLMRSWGRLTGSLLGSTEGPQKETFVQALKAEGRKVPKDDQALLALASEMASQHERDFKNYRKEYDSGERVKSKLVKAAERYKLTAQGEIVEIPRGGNDRQWITTVLTKAVGKLKTRGIDLMPAEAQAVWWNPEKTLYEAYGGKVRDTDTDYANGFARFAEKKGVKI